MSTPEPTSANYASSNPAPATSGKKTLAILSLVFGIVSTVLGLIILPIVWLLLGVAGVILGFMSRSREPGGRKIALAGIILSFVGIAVSILSWIIGAIAIANMMSTTGM